MGNALNRATQTTNRDGLASARGYSLIEVLIVVALGISLAGMAIPLSNDFISTSKADSSVVALTGALEAAKSRAVSERRNIRLTFNGTNQIIVERMEVPSGTATLISNTPLEGAQQFYKFAISDTPDNFGSGPALSFTGTAPYMFSSDGTLVDTNGDVANGTVFIGIPGKVDSARAVTIFGVTGLMRTWKWRGNAWVE